VERAHYEHSDTQGFPDHRRQFGLGPISGLNPQTTKACIAAGLWICSDMSQKIDFGNTYCQHVVGSDMFSGRVAKS
jgi:hypothetical protein